MATLDELDVPEPPMAHDRARRAAAVGLVLWLIVVAASMLWPHYWKLDPLAGISAAPFYGHWAWSAPGWMLVAVAFGVAAVLGLPRLFSRLRPVWIPVVAGAVGAGWAVTLAATGGGLHKIAAPLESKYEVLPFAAHIDGSTFVRTFVASAHRYPTHVMGHPPGLVLVFWLLDRVGLVGPGWAAALVLAGWGIGVAAVVWTVGNLAGSRAAGRAAPFVALVPAVVWAATSVDALIAGVTAVGIALVVAAMVVDGDKVDRRLGRADVLALCGGLVIGGALYLSYGVAPLLLVPVVVAVWRRRARPLVLAAVGMAVVVALFSLAGFWWLDGLSLTRGFYFAGLARVRPFAYFALAGNLGALALAAGPAVAAGMGRMVGSARRRPELVVLGAVAVAVLLADVSGMSKAEVERIWLPFTLWLAAAGGAAAEGRSVRRTQGWLAVQVGLALLLQAWLVTPW
jgi:hypothetical protein